MRLHVSAKAAGDINAQFSSLIGLTQQPDKLNEISYQVTLLLQDLSDQLASVPVPARTVQPEVTTTTDQGHAWQLKNKIRIGRLRVNRLRTMLSLLPSHNISKAMWQAAMLSVQDAYFDLFEASGMENRVGAADSKFKAQLEGYFTRMVSQMKSGRPVAEIQQQQQGLSQDSQTAVGRLQKDTNTSWNLFISSLLILLREGLEALLIVAAIVAYLVKKWA